MATSVEFHSSAREEFDDAFNWYAVRSPTAAVNFAHEVEIAVEKIERDPERFASTYANCQYCQLDHYPYCIGIYTLLLAVGWHEDVRSDT